MENELLILCLAIASVGFILWYAFATSLRLPSRYQVMYDNNPPYVKRVLRRRTFGVIIYALVPLMIIRWTDWVSRPSLHDLNISFQVNTVVLLYSVIGIVLVIVIALQTTRTQSSLEVYPEVRVRFWRPNILFLSALTWTIYIVAVEFFYRGLLFQTLLVHLDPIPALAACTGLYGLANYFRLNRLTIVSLMWGLGSCLIVLQTNSIVPVIVIHLTMCLVTEWLSIKHHMEMYVRRT
jgi:membrane protease YdiL (CAAX protease family)